MLDSKVLLYKYFRTLIIKWTLKPGKLDKELISIEIMIMQALTEMLSPLKEQFSFQSVKRDRLTMFNNCIMRFCLKMQILIFVWPSWRDFR